MRETILLRWSQAGMLLCGLLLIMIGVGMRAVWLRSLLQLAISGAVAGVIYESRLYRRGEGDGMAVLLPLVSGLSGLLVLVAAP